MTKNTVIVYYHPYAGSFCHGILEAVTSGVQQAGGTVDLIDLGADGFNPVMSGADLLAFRKHTMVDPQAQAYVARLQKADELVLIFPIWWELMPAMVKGFIDKVIFPGSTYEYTHGGKGMRTLLTNVQRVQVYTTMNTPGWLYRTLYGNAIQRSLIRGTLRKSGLRNVHLKAFYAVKGTKRAQLAHQLAQITRSFQQ